MPIIWIDSVTDRKQEDVDRVNELNAIGWDHMTSEQKEEWSNGLKGALNRSDLLRIENNIQILSDVLGLNLMTFANNVPGNPTIGYFSILLENVEKIRGAYGKKSTTPETPEAPINTFEKLNAIEQILKDVYDLLTNNFHYYAGEGLYAGQDTALLL